MQRFFALFSAALAPVSFVVPPAAAGDSSTEQVVLRHNRAMGARNLDAIMEDYADNAILIDPAGVARGKAAIRKSFEGLLSIPNLVLAPPSRQLFEGEVAYLVWTPEPGKPGREGAETLIVRGGKIVAQTVAAFGPPPGGPQ
jgi:hypothetical protein